MSSKRAFSCSYSVHILLVVSIIVEGSPVATNLKAADDATALKAKDAPILKETEAPNHNEEATAPKGATNEIETSPATFKTNFPTTLKPVSPATTKDGKRHEDMNNATTKNPTSDEKFPLKPSPHLFGDLTQGSSVKQTTQAPTALHNTQKTRDKHIKMTRTPLRSHKKPSPVRITRIYRVKSQKGCSGNKKEHDVKVHVGEGRYLNIKITED